MSDSAKFKITSRNEGTDPVSIAFSRGMVIVGEVACAVKGTAAPDRINLSDPISQISPAREIRNILLSETES